jgi:hypothetical protein
MGAKGVPQGMRGATQAVHVAQVEGGGTCKAVEKTPVTLSLATITAGLSLESVVSGAMGVILLPFVSGLCGFYDDLVMWAKGQAFIFETGNLITYDQPTVVKMHDALLPVVGAIIALLFVLAGHRIIMGANPLRVLPRIILASILAFASAPLLKASIDVNNGLCQLVINAAAISKPGENIASLFLMGTNPQDLSSINWLAAVILVVMGIGVALQALVRVGILDILWVIWPLVALCYGDAAWQKWANLWTCAWVATVFVQFLQVIVVCLGAALVGNFGGVAPVAMLVGIAILFLTMKVPGWLSSAVSNTLSGVPSVYQVIGDAINSTIDKAKTIALFV